VGALLIKNNKNNGYSSRLTNRRALSLRDHFTEIMIVSQSHDNGQWPNDDLGLNSQYKSLILRKFGA
jgi:hypothetical protein